MHFTLRKINRRRRLAWKMILFGQFSRPERKRMCVANSLRCFDAISCLRCVGCNAYPGIPSVRNLFLSLPRMLPRAFIRRFVRKSQLSLTKTVWNQEKLAWINFFENQHISSCLARPAIYNKCYIYAGFSTKRFYAALHFLLLRLRDTISAFSCFNLRGCTFSRWKLKLLIAKLGPHLWTRFETQSVEKWDEEISDDKHAGRRGRKTLSPNSVCSQLLSLNQATTTSFLSKYIFNLVKSSRLPFSRNSLQDKETNQYD